MTSNIETVNNKLCTVTWHKPKGWAESLDDTVMWVELIDGHLIATTRWMKAHIATAYPIDDKEPRHD